MVNLQINKFLNGRVFLQGSDKIIETLNWNNHKGKRSLTMGEINFLLKKDDIFIVNPGEIHSCNTLSNLPCSYMSVCFSEKAYVDLLNVKYKLFEKEALLKSPLVNGHILRNLFEKLLITIKERSNSLENQDLVSEIIFRITRIRNCGRNTSFSERELLNKVEETRLYIAANYNKNIDLRGLTLGIGWSKFHLRRLFVKEVGLTLHDYITQLRLKNGIRYIDDGITLSRAAYETGFVDQSHFSKVFRKYNGITPGEFGGARIELPLGSLEGNGIKLRGY